MHMHNAYICIFIIIQLFLHSIYFSYRRTTWTKVCALNRGGIWTLIARIPGTVLWWHLKTGTTNYIYVLHHTGSYALLTLCGLKSKDQTLIISKISMDLVAVEFFLKITNFLLFSFTSDINPVLLLFPFWLAFDWCTIPLCMKTWSFQ